MSIENLRGKPGQGLISLSFKLCQIKEQTLPEGQQTQGIESLT